MGKLKDQKKNIVIVSILLVIIAVVAVFGFGNRTRTTAPAGEKMDLPNVMDLVIPSAGAEGIDQTKATAIPEVTAEPETAEAAAESEASGEAGAEEQTPEYKGAVLVTLSGSGQYGWLPVPMEGEYIYPITQTDSEGNYYENRVHITPDGVNMEYSTCENQDCVGQGVVTFENKDERILANYIICLPNQVTLELFTMEEVEAMYAQNSGEQ